MDALRQDTNLRRWPWLLVVTPVALALLGLAGIARGDELSGAGVLYDRQVIWLALAAGAMWVGTRLPLRWVQQTAWVWLLVSVLLLLLVYVFPPRWGSRRWIPLGLLYFQPSELAKLTCIAALARLLSRSDSHRRLMGLIVPFLVTLVPLGLILKEPDLGTSLLFLPVLYGMLWTAGARGWHLLLIALLGVCLLPIFWSAISAEQKSRITAVFQQRDGSAPQQGVADGYHLHQSKQVLSFGGAWGSQAQGTLIDDPAAYYLPACRTDFVLCMVGERFGLAGTLTTLFLYGVLSLSGLFVAGTSRDPFGRLLAVGVTVLLAAQTIINTGMTVGLVPITGITLPLMSYGGSSLLFTGLALGLMVQVARQPHDPMSLPASIQPRRSPSAAWQSN